MLATRVSEKLGGPWEAFALMTIRQGFNPSTPRSWKRVHDYKIGCCTMAQYDHWPLQKPHLRPWGFATVKERWKVTIKDIAHGMMAHLKHLEASDRPLRQKHNRPNHIYELSQEQAADFWVQSIYKQCKDHTTTLYYPARKSARITYVMSNEEVENSPWFLALPQEYKDVILKAQRPTADSPQPASP